MNYSKIVATGSYLPEKVLDNKYFEATLDTTDEWITSRSGIKKRHIIGENEKTSDMAYAAAIDAINSSNFDKSKIDMIIVATFSGDTPFPSVGCLLQHRLGLEHIPAFDLNAVCSGFLYALVTADCYIKSNMAKNILVIGVDAISNYIDYTDRSTCVLFGDGAGAVILQASDTEGIIRSELHSDGSGECALTISGGLKHGKVFGKPLVYMDGKAVYKMAVKNLATVATSLLKTAGYDQNQLDWLIPHQANIRIIEATANHLGLSMDKVITTVATHGNTSAASVPLALDHAIKENKVKRGDLLMLEGVGAGFTWGASLIRY